MNFTRFFVRRFHEKCRISSVNDSMKVKVVGRDVVRPSSPTPNHLRNFKVSLMEQLGQAVFSPLVFFYPADHSHGTDHAPTPVQQLEKLKKSLSETLTQYYPLAGRLRDNKYIECNDNGADFIEAEIAAPLSSFLYKPDPEGLSQLLPICFQSEDAKSKLLLAQASFFSCGGMAIGVCLSHKLADGTSVTTFMKSWAASATARPWLAPRPIFDMASIFHPRDLEAAPPDVIDTTLTDQATKERFVFDAPRIQALQSEYASKDVDRPTRVEAVSGLIWKSLLKAARTASGSSRPSVLVHSVNIRPRVDPPLDAASIGNLVSCFSMRVDETEDCDPQTLVSKIRKAKEEYLGGHAKELRGNEKAYEAIIEYQSELVRMLGSRQFEYYLITSTCGFGLYEADFGWGRPAWVTVPCPNMPNIVILSDTGRDGGIEAWVALEKDKMKLFREDAEMLQFASLNPPLCQ